MGCIILIYQKMKLQSKNYEILNKQKLRKKIYIYLPLTCFVGSRPANPTSADRVLRKQAASGSSILCVLPTTCGEQKGEEGMMFNLRKEDYKKTKRHVRPRLPNTNEQYSHNAL